MITDPTTLLALALCVGILGLAVLILPLLIVFWSQMEPQLVGMVGGDENGGAGDEYDSQAVLPRLMKSFGHMAEIEKERSEKEAASRKPAGKKATPAARSKVRSTKQTVKAAPSRTKPKAGDKTKKVSKATVKPKASGSAKTKAKPKVAAKSKAGAAAKAAPKSSAKPKPKAKTKAAARRAPAGAKRDQVLGIVYTKKPKEIDDLKEIKGVAKVIEGKLHKVGIYTFQQIVEWDDAAIDAFSDKLAFKGRIRNEDWQKQCAKFHKAKYGEKIG